MLQRDMSMNNSCCCLGGLILKQSVAQYLNKKQLLSSVQFASNKDC